MSELPPAARDTDTAPPSVLRLEGQDTLAVLHNISTQSLSDLERGEARATLFCDFRGRLLHRAAVLRTQDDRVWLVRPDAPGDDLAAYLDRHVFREDVRITDVSAAWEVALRRDATAPSGRVEESADRTRITLDGACTLEMRPRGSEPMLRALPEAQRVQLGWPRHGHEIRDEFNAFEVNLGGDVRLDKGCFTGQEALMRLVTYRSVRRRLVSLAGLGDPVETAEVRDPAGEKIGRLTSVVSAGGTQRDTWTGLAVLRLESAVAGAALRIEAAEAATVAHVFPFASPGGRPFQL